MEHQKIDLEIDFGNISQSAFNTKKISCTVYDVEADWNMSLSTNRSTEKRIADELTKRENSQHKTEKKTGEIKKERVLQQSD